MAKGQSSVAEEELQSARLSVRSQAAEKARQSAPWQVAAQARPALHIQATAIFQSRPRQGCILN